METKIAKLLIIEYLSDLYQHIYCGKQIDFEAKYARDESFAYVILLQRKDIIALLDQFNTEIFDIINHSYIQSLISQLAYNYTLYPYCELE